MQDKTDKTWWTAQWTGLNMFGVPSLGTVARSRGWRHQIAPAWPSSSSGQALCGMAMAGLAGLWRAYDRIAPGSCSCHMTTCHQESKRWTLQQMRQHRPHAFQTNSNQHRRTPPATIPTKLGCEDALDLESVCTGACVLSTCRDPSAWRCQPWSGPSARQSSSCQGRQEKKHIRAEKTQKVQNGAIWLILIPWSSFHGRLGFFHGHLAIMTMVIIQWMMTIVIICKMPVVIITAKTSGKMMTVWRPWSSFQEWRPCNHWWWPWSSNDDHGHHFKRMTIWWPWSSFFHGRHNDDHEDDHAQFLTKSRISNAKKRQNDKLSQFRSGLDWAQEIRILT